MQARPVPEVTVQELLDMQRQGKKVLVVDVREQSEYDADNIGGKLIPVGDLSKRFEELSKDQLIVMHCRSGGRSGRAVAFMMEQGYTNVKNLKGGITAYREVVKKADETPLKRGP